MNKINKCKDFILNRRHIFLLGIPFLLIDFFIRILGHKLSFSVFHISPILFTITWIILFVGCIASFNSKIGKCIYWFLLIISTILAITQSVYLNTTDYYFSFNLVMLAGEGSEYILTSILNTNLLIYIGIIVIFIIGILVSKTIPKDNKFSYKKLIATIIIFIIMHMLAVMSLGKMNSDLKWNSFNKPRNIYESFSDSNKSLKISGLFEYTIRDIYINFLKPEDEISKDDKAFLDECYADTTLNPDNAYTGIFQGKNVIFLQLEGIDDWLLTKDTMPNLYSLLNHSINFTDHYSMYTGGGSTFNSEFSLNTGFTTPISYITNVYTLNTNTYKLTLPRLFKERGYVANAFHMNSSDFYSRGVNYKSWGYDNYYGLVDINNVKDTRFTLDRELILDETFYNEMFKQDKPFLNYIITYTPHTPFSTETAMCKLLAAEKYGADNIPDLSEEECVKMAAGETDYMVGLLMQALKDNDLYDNTVIVAFSDHYLYTLADKTILDKYKDTSNNLINHTPFFIWSSDLEPKEINEPTMQINILPTVLNMFGFEFNTCDFIGTDALNPEYKGIAFFDDYSWYDGQSYVEDSKITNQGILSQTNIDYYTSNVYDVIRKNDLTLKYDYFKNR